VAQATIRCEKDETRNKLNKKWNLSLEMRVGDDYSPALVFLRKGNTAALRRTLILDLWVGCGLNVKGSAE
jgi:hypothetical protein